MAISSSQNTARDTNEHRHLSVTCEKVPGRYVVSNEMSWCSAYVNLETPTILPIGQPHRGTQIQDRKIPTTMILPRKSCADDGAVAKPKSRRNSVWRILKGIRQKFP